MPIALNHLLAAASRADVAELLAEDVVFHSRVADYRVAIAGMRDALAADPLPSTR
jgi:hypothetical protein